MEAGLMLDVMPTNAPHDTEAQEAGAFNASWQPTDTAHLQPANLPIARVQRAWERKPLSPLNRRKVRVGKVWKRAALTVGAPRDAAAMEGEGEEQQRGGKRGKPRSHVLLQSPLLKPVKKLCMDSDYGVGPRVSQWEGRGSPVRKIVTRSAVAGALIALPDDEEVELVHVHEDEHATTEILDEEGNVLDGDEDDDEAKEEWLDVEEEQDNAADLPFDDAMMHLGDAIEHSQQLPELDQPQQVQLPEPDEQIDNSPTNQPVPETKTEGQQLPETATQGQEETVPAEATMVLSEEQLTTHLHDAPAVAPRQHIALPDGFVSPAKQRRKLGPRSSRLVAAARRQTLPVQFAPAVSAPQTPGDNASEANASIAALDHAAAVEVGISTEDHAEMLRSGESHGAVDAMDDVIGDGEWEDVEEDVELAEVLIEQCSAVAVTPLIGSHDSSGEAHDDATLDVDMEPLPASHDMLAGSTDDLQASGPGPVNTRGHELAGRLPSSPVPTIDGPHPRLPLRRSPRRQSSSPLKRSTTAQSMEKPHMVALTPLKRPDSSSRSKSADALSSSRNDARLTETDDMMDFEPASPATLASSAPPPEEPDASQPSPRKPVKPRVSDDTALLQAFLNRAAESKSSRHVSATSKQESFENRRDSDAVKAALAGPPKPDVLMELDPNSPAPRKPSGGSGTTPVDCDANGITMMMMTPTDLPSPIATTATRTADDQQQQDDDEQIQYETEPEPAAPKTTTRRSGRGRKKPQVLSQSVYSAPSRITIRGPMANANLVDPKRTEAQELATATRNNTRKNKGGSVLPNLRIAKMMAAEGKGGAGAGGGVDGDGDGGGDVGLDVAMVDVAATTEDGGALDDGAVVMAMVEGRRGVQWAETLVEFYQGGAGELEATSQMSDEGEEQPRMPWERPAKAMEEEEDEGATKGDGEEVVETVAAPPAPADTPSKPRLRRLKLPRTAAMPAGKTPPPPPPAAALDTTVKADAKGYSAAAPHQAPQQQQPKLVPKPRRSRIATPAKGLLATTTPTNNTVLFPAAAADVPGPAPPPTAAKKAAAPRKKAGSKLPAPAPATTSSSLGSGKENLGGGLGASPAKKKRPAAAGAGSTLPTAKLFAPKLDFGGGANIKFEPAAAPTGEVVEAAPPGLLAASPAKKGGSGGRKAAAGGLLFGGAAVSAMAGGQERTGGDGGGGAGDEAPLGLRSPAKKRPSRRAAGQ
ncbi:hypothetical protein LTR36_006016 [Oleoguttula mirabilis]|uniref:Uncharacterized protein n=1 Tax=Oleoguttula mirabilis TaxID=1507867 RepID=A0AAV9JD23_9PEZI|nr:hypothetical protein LTR36_006016 [Oleoguttula mirabilis]